MKVARSIVLAGCIMVPAATGAWGWATSVGGAFAAGQLAVDARGDVVTRVPGSVVKLSGETGAVLWQTPAETIGPSGPLVEDWNAIATDASADVVAGGRHTRGNSGNRLSRFLVVKLSGASAAELWRRTIECDGGRLGFDSAQRLAVDPAGDVVVTASICGNPEMLKLSGASGDVLWRRQRRYTTVSVDANGDVIAGEPYPSLESPPRIEFVEKLSGADGSSLWRHVLEPPRPGEVIALDASGNVLLPADRDFGVVKLAADSGTPIWRRTIRGSTVPFYYTVRSCSENGICYDQRLLYRPTNFVRGLAVAPRGDVIAVGARTTSQPKPISRHQARGRTGYGAMAPGHQGAVPRHPRRLRWRLCGRSRQARRCPRGRHYQRPRQLFRPRDREAVGQNRAGALASPGRVSVP